MIRVFISFCAISILSLVVFVQSADAQKRAKFSSSEDIAIAFYKTGKVVPNFERWIEQRPPYKNTSPARRPKVMEEEKLRLQTAYQQFNPSKDYLLIRTFVQLFPEEHKDEEGNVSYKLKVVFEEAPDALYFPYDFLGERIVVMPSKLDTHMHGDIEKYRYDYISQTSGVHMMTAKLRVRKADLSRPYEIDGLEQWVLVTDIVSLEVWSKAESLLWEYTAPWYVSPHTKKINNLYNLRPTESGKSGSIKSLD